MLTLLLGPKKGPNEIYPLEKVGQDRYQLTNKVLDGEMFMLQQMRLRFLKFALESDEALNHVKTCIR